MSENLASVLGGLTGMDAPIDRETDEDYTTHNVATMRTVKLGRQGEHMTQTVEIDASAWLDRLPGCALVIACTRPGETEVYLPQISVTDGVITWHIVSQDTALAGWGRAEVRAMVDGRIKKSATFRTMVEPSLAGDGTVLPPAPPDWVQTIIDGANAAQDTAAAAARVEQAALDAKAYARDIEERLDSVLRVGYVEPDYLWEMGYISESSGLVLTDGYNGTRRCSTGGYIALRAGDYVACDEGYSARMYVYAASAQAKPDKVVPSGDFSAAPIVAEADCFVRITARRTGNAEVAADEIAQHVRVTLRTAVVRAVEDAEAAMAAVQIVDEKTSGTVAELRAHGLFVDDDGRFYVEMEE